MKRSISVLLVGFGVCLNAYAFFGTNSDPGRYYASTYTMPAAGTFEVAFSPNEGSLQLVLKVIRSAKSEIDVMAYSFTSAPVVDALLSAVHRGVQVNMVVDWKENRSVYAQRALSALVNAGVHVKMIDVYPIAHDKVIISDRQTTETGSFNYSKQAAEANSENVLVVWNNSQLAQVYFAHFMRNWRQGRAYLTAY